MKLKLTAISIAVAALLLPAESLLAQSKTNYPGLLSGTEIKAAEVTNLQNQEIGTVQEVLLDPSSGRVRFAILSVGGFLGLGATEVAVPWEALRISKEDNRAKYVLDATKERLEKAPRVEGKRYDRLYTRQEAEPTYVYWGIRWWDVDPITSPTPTASPKASPSPSPTAR